MRKLRIALFILVAEIHALAIVSLGFDIQPVRREERAVRVMKLADLAEYVPPPPDPPEPPPPPVVEPPPPKPPPPEPEPPPPPELPPEPEPVVQAEPPPDNAVETIAEVMIETEEEPEEQILVEIAAGTPIAETGEEPEEQAPANSIPAAAAAPEAVILEEEYLPAHRISDMPVFPEDQILAALVYPPVAKRAGIQGRVVLDLFIDRTGAIRRIDILLEDPSGRGFGEAARKAFQGIVCEEPAKANGQDVSARIRYPVRFRLRD
ncbi:MAG: energy transducer TonB [Treponema sp.]|jgi:protein TonB|nr:energy transducer TonB [Treponema sp.]